MTRKMEILSAMSRPMRDDQRTRCGNTPPSKEESSKSEGSTVLDIEALMREAVEKLKAQVEAGEKFKMETKPGER